jgi:hypothetical protein
MGQREDGRKGRKERGKGREWMRRKGAWVTWRGWRGGEETPCPVNASLLLLRAHLTSLYFTFSVFFSAIILSHSLLELLFLSHVCWYFDVLYF